MNREDDRKSSKTDQDTLVAVGFVVLMLLAGLLHWLHQPGAVPAVWPAEELYHDSRFAP